jgi:hypothetical protein
MTLNKTAVCMVLVFSLFFFLGANGAVNGMSLPTGLFQEATPEPQSDVDQAIRDAFQKSIQQNRNQVLGFQVFDVVVDHIQYSSDNMTAMLWLAMRDPQTGEIVASEPGLSIVRSSLPFALGSSDNWTFTQQQESTFVSQLEVLPADLLTDEIRNRFFTPLMDAGLTAAPPLSGYKLPWTAGLSKRLTNAIGHVVEVSGGLTSCPASCRYAYDFADGTMFPLLAAKGGTIKAYKISCSNGDTNCTNFLVLEDQSTIPTSYQLYYHMAYNSIPQNLRTIGTRVSQGQYIGDVDDTGYSTGHHLHFHVYTTPTGSNWSWGNSVDFKFDDVATNGGYPRTCAEASQYPALGSQCTTNNIYTSGNTPSNPPSASLTAPQDRQMVTTRTVKVSGKATDDIQIARIQVMVNYDGTWKAVSDIPPVSGTFSQDVDLCAAGVPDGPFGLTLRVYDREGSLAKGVPVRQIIKSGSCTSSSTPPPVPACTPTVDQVALYSETDFRGDCTKFTFNNSKGYTVSDIGAVGDNNAASIQVGSNVRAVLYDKNTDVTAAQVTGRLETISASDANLADNLIGADVVSGLWVIARSDLLDAPFINQFGNQIASTNPTSLDSLVFAWEGGSGATGYDVTLTGPTAIGPKTVTGRTSFSAGSLAPGSYTLTVKANAKTLSSSRNVVKNFSVTSASFPAVNVRTAPYQESFESGSGDWIASGLWRFGLINAGGRGASNVWAFNDGADYTNATWRAGDMTSPPIMIPAGAPYYLRFSYFADVEGGTPYWDQRLVQISDGGAFKDLLQFTGDKQEVQSWLNSGPINLAAYAGKTIRLRFHFDTVDEENNAGAGWMVDDVSVTAQAPNTSCADDGSTQPIAMGGSVSSVICPEGDLDLYSFAGTSGQPIKVDINARSLSPASQLDSYVYLLDSDGLSVLAENDDEQPGVVQDSQLLYTLRRSGTYYLKVKAWDYPGAGGPNHFYQLGLSQNVVQPPQEVKFLFPPENRMASVNAFDITVSAVDADGGQVAQVDFYWHGPDWSKPEWVKLGTDTNSSNGWTYNVNPALYGGVKGSAVYVQASSRTGGVLGAILWDLLADQTTPVSQLAELPGKINSSVVKLQWTAADEQSDIDHFDLQFQANTGAGWSGWQDWTARPLLAQQLSTWFEGVPGSYRFRIRAVDRAGNAEAYPEAPEASTTIASPCSPDPAEGQGQTFETAISLPRSSASGLYNLCKAALPGSGDVDWVAMNVKAGENVLVMLRSKGGGAAFSVNLYSPSRQLLGTWKSLDYGTGVTSRWSPASAGTYYLEIKPLQASLFGTDTLYQVWYGPGNWIYLPSIGN